MSFLPIGLSIGQLAALNLVKLILIRPRSIGPFVAYCAVEEIHTDELEITHHPVEIGAAVADHAFKRPASVSIKTGWSNASFQALTSGGVDGFLQAIGNPSFIQDTYQKFLALQASRQPFDITTGKRQYSNMLINRLSVTTDQHTENILLMTVDCREVIMVSTQTVTVPDASKMKDPASNAPTTDAGVKQLQPAPNFNTAGAP